MNEKVIFLKQGPNLMQGIHHLPIKGNDKKVGILLCNAGLIYHVGLARIYVGMARTLANSGFHVLRFDPYGTGDSDGSFENSLTKDLFTHIEHGAFIDDTLAMFDHFFEISPIKSIIIAGICGGGITAMLSTPRRHKKIIGIIAAGLPVLYSAAEKQRFECINRDMIQMLRTTYINKVFNVKAWKRVFTGETNFRLLFKVFSPEVHPNGQIASTDLLTGKNPAFNCRLYECFCQIADKKIPLLFIYASEDTERSYFEEYFLKILLHPNGPYKDSYQYEIIENGDHNFCLPAARQKFIQVTSAWAEKLTG